MLCATLYQEKGQVSSGVRVPRRVSTVSLRFNVGFSMSDLLTQIKSTDVDGPHIIYLAKVAGLVLCLILNDLVESVRVFFYVNRPSSKL